MIIALPTFANRRECGLTSCVFGDDQRNVVSLFVRAESLGLIGNRYK
jgi:hypothetical protein